VGLHLINGREMPVQTEFQNFHAWHTNGQTLEEKRPVITHGSINPETAQDLAAKIVSISTA
jgi:hypothetical protein